MSRGPGKLQRLLFNIIKDKRRPMTFRELMGGEISPSLQRSCRRALHNMTADKALMTFGTGRPGDPYQYYLHPLTIFVAISDKAEREELIAGFGGKDKYLIALGKLIKRGEAKK